MVSYLVAFGWGILVLLSWIGWGSVLSRTWFPRETTDWGMRGAWGLAFSVVFGGLLNLLGRISRTTVLVYVAIGIAAWAIELLIHQRRGADSTSRRAIELCRSKILLVGGALVVLLALLQYAGSVTVVRHDYPSGFAGAIRFNQADDFQAYFVFPEKMLQLGSMGRDPFSARRVESSLGGQSFLHTLLLSVLSVQHLHILDPGLGLLLTLGLLWGNVREKGTPAAWSIGLLLLVVLIDPPAVNIASLYTGAALFLCLYRTLAWEALPTTALSSRIVIISLIAAAICSLKSNLIPACGVLLACSFIAYLISQKFARIIIVESVLTAVLTIVLVLPWMISMRQSSGTLLYPLLGNGYHLPFRWLTVSGALRVMFKHLADPDPLALVALGGFYLVSRRRGLNGREACLSLLIGAVVGHIVITLATAEPNNSRYSFPFVLAAILALMTEASSLPETRFQAQWQASAPLFTGAVAVFLIGASWFGSRTLYTECVRGTVAGLRQPPLVSNQEVKAYRLLQQSIPPGDPILARLEMPFLLDFKRNPAFVVDYAVTSPPPGMPLVHGGEALASYLNSQSIRYVAYSYNGEADRWAAPLHDIYSPFTIFQIKSTADFEVELEQLARTRRHIYEDGNSFVLDLLQTNTNAAQIESRPVTLSSR